MENAKDYLLDFAAGNKCDKWIRNVIYTFIKADGEVSAEEQHGLIDELFDEPKDMLPPKDVKQTSNKDSNISFLELKHISGVNALEPNQTIKFGKDITIVYGLNGSGKSSYFRILNAISNKKNPADIIGNIYSENQPEIKASLNYKHNGKENKYDWDNSKTGIKEASSVRIFDTSYTSGLLKKRNSDELLVKPFQLSLFSDVISFIEELRQKANTRIKEDESSLPDFDGGQLDEKTKSILSQEIISQEEEEYIDNTALFTETDRQRVKEITQEVELLQKENAGDQITLEKEHKKQLQSIHNKIIKMQKSLNDCLEEAEKLISAVLEAKKLSEEARLRNDSLKNIPGINSESWKQFINASQKYMKEHSIQVCPFCRRPYDDDSLRLVTSYASYLADKNEIEYKKQSQNLKELREQVNLIHILSLEEYDYDYIQENIKDQLLLDLSDMKMLKDDILDAIDSLSISNKSKVEANSSKQQIEEYIANMEKRIDELSADQKVKDDKVEELRKELKILQAKQSLHDQISSIKSLIAAKKSLADKKKKLASINTNKLSNLSRNAHNKLLTEQLEEKFSTILKEFRIRDVDIELKAQNNKGIQQTELMIKGKRKVEQILSEGEQKATALALFLAEIQISENHSVLVFDDPVNSMDQRVMGAFAEKLLEMNNQIIVFTHNRLFLDSFNESDNGHFCKTYDTDCGKKIGRHILLYETKSEGRDSKGIISKAKIDSAKTYLEAVEKLLSESPFTKNQEACIKLRLAVELLIDEVVFNKQVPTKYSTKANRINWKELKNISNDSWIIDNLKMVHNRCSGGELHNGLERNENPVEKAEIQEMLDKLKAIKNRGNYQHNREIVNIDFTR